MRWLRYGLNWLRLPGPRRALVTEAALLLLAARFAVRWIPYRRLTWFFERRAAGPEVTGERRLRLIKDIRGVIYQITGHGPDSIFVCFPRAIAAQAMLRRRGVSTTLYYGAQTVPGEGLKTHVWVMDGDIGVIGSLLAPGYKVLARYPADLTPPTSQAGI